MIEIGYLSGQKREGEPVKIRGKSLPQREDETSTIDGIEAGMRNVEAITL